MCVLAVSKPDAVMEKRFFLHCANTNRNGMGLAYVDPAQKKVVIDKGYLDVEKFHKRYLELVGKGFNKNFMLIHFRFATAGGESLDNCHPFPIKGGALGHNGTYFGRGQQMGGKSDTRIVAERMYNNLEYKVVNRNREEFEKAFGYSRTALLYDGGECIIFNEKNGTWHDNVWYSNSGFKPRWTEWDDADYGNHRYNRFRE